MKAKGVFLSPSIYGFIRPEADGTYDPIKCLLEEARTLQGSGIP